MSSGIGGYLLPIVLITANYALFQAANNTVLMTGLGQQQRGTISGLLSLSRNFGFITGTAAMGAIFATASTATDVNAKHPEAISRGMRTTFAVAAILIGLALALGRLSRRSRHHQTASSTI